MSESTKLPDGWVETTFGAVVSAVSVNDKKLPRGQYLESGRFPVVDQGQQFIGGYSDDEARVISEDLPLLVFGDHTRAFKYLNQPFVPGADGIKVLKPHGVDAKWLYEIAHALEFPDKGYARHYQHLKSAKLFVPPPDEQRRIVAEIEKQFTRLEAGVSALKRVQANLKRYRAAVLKALIGADESPRISLVDLAKPGAKVLYGILQPGPEIPDGIPYVRPTEIHLDKIQLGDIRKTSPEIAAKYTRSTLRTGDIILSIVGTIGKVATVPAELEGGNITQSSVRIRPDKAKVRGDYLTWVLRSPFAIRQYDAARLGTAVPRLNVAHVRDLKIPVPSLAEQTRIVAEVERRLSVVEELEAVVSANLQRATRLRQSILQLAFTGNV